MLIQSKRPTKRDLERWAYWQTVDTEHAKRWTDKKMSEAQSIIETFLSAGRCYAGVSWGKDSVVLAHLIADAQLDVPMVYVRCEPECNPDCDAVRDEFLRQFPGVMYDEITVASGGKTVGRLNSGFAKASEMHGNRHVSGVRGSESGARKLRMLRYGPSTERACAPIGWWAAQDVWTHLHVFDLPVHPAYACSFGGMLDRDRIRVATLGGERGTGHGRREWEERYYREEMGRLAQ